MKQGQHLTWLTLNADRNLKSALRAADSRPEFELGPSNKKELASDMADFE